MIDVFATEPDFINELGVKWWIDKMTTNYAQSPDVWGTRLNAMCFFVEEPGGRRTRVLIDRGTENVLAEDQALDGIGCKIDILKALKRS